MTEAEAHHLDLRPGSVADSWIEQVMVPGPYGQLFEELVLPPPGAQSNARGLVPQFGTLGERSNGGFRGGHGEPAPCDEQGTLEVTGGGARRRVGGETVQQVVGGQVQDERLSMRQQAGKRLAFGFGRSFDEAEEQAILGTG